MEIKQRDVWERPSSEMQLVRLAERPEWMRCFSLEAAPEMHLRGNRRNEVAMRLDFCLGDDGLIPESRVYIMPEVEIMK